MIRSSENDLLTIAIDGPSASGKSRLGLILSQRLSGNLFSMDDFFLPGRLEKELSISKGEGNIDFKRFKKDVLSKLADKEGIKLRPFDCKAQKYLTEKSYEYSRVSIIEGAYCLSPLLEYPYQLKIFLDIDPDEQEKRIKERNGQEGWKIFKELWIPMENSYFEKYSIRDKADLIIGLKK